MSKTQPISVSEIVGGPYSVSHAGGQKLHDKIKPAVVAGETVTVSFAGITTVTTAFLNVAIGQLCKNYTKKQIFASIKFVDMEDDDRELVEYVVDSALIYFKDPERIKKIEDEAYGDSRDTSD